MKTNLLLSIVVCLLLPTGGNAQLRRTQKPVTGIAKTIKYDGLQEIWSFFEKHGRKPK